MNEHEYKILVVDDEIPLAKMVKRILTAAPGLRVSIAHSGDDALLQLATEPAHVVLCDVSMPGLSGDRLLQHVKERTPSTEVVLMTGYASVEQATWAVKFGAFDYIKKPFESDDALRETILRAARRAASVMNEVPAAAPTTEHSVGGLAGRSAGMQRVQELIRRVAPSDAAVLIRGESGTGKELVARAIHRESRRRDKPFVAVNCAALPENLIESELFGHNKGAFTGAETARRGLFEAAHGGTIFLDEIGDMPASAQVRLLRVLQEGEIRRVGANENIKIDVRVIAASHVNFRAAISEGRFRTDLFFRLAVFELLLPALRERPEDIMELATLFLQRYSAKAGAQARTFSPEAAAALQAYAWPGNVRELENCAQRAAVLTTSDIAGVDCLPESIVQATRGARAPAGRDLSFDLPFADQRRAVIDGFERRYLEQLMEQNKGNISAAARVSGIDRSNLKRLLKQHTLLRGDLPQAN